MSNYAPSTRKRIADINLGIRVDRAAATMTGASTKSLFNVEGGRVLVRALVGEVTVAVANSTNNAKFVSTPDVGSVADMCAVGATQNLGIGGLVSLPGTSIATAMHVSSTTAAGAVPACNTSGIIAAAGVIGYNNSHSTDGTLKFSIWYVPLDEGAYVTSV